jgi:glycosyltransferase involved in cell wall biosynthesis
MDPLRLLPQLVATARSMPNTVLQVNGHRDVLERGGARTDAALMRYLDEAVAQGHVDLRVHDFMSDDELWDYLESLDVSVLPYRFGTHSGWLEACRDLGTAVVAPDCGHYADQGATAIYHHREDSYDPASLDRALRHVFEVGAPPPAPIEERRQQRAWVAAAHRRIYQEALNGARA